MKVFVYKGKTSGLPEKRERLIQEALVRTARDSGAMPLAISGEDSGSVDVGAGSLESNNADCLPEILRAEGGKPYADIDGIEFSVSHSGDWWVCAVNNEPVGIDVEIIDTERDVIPIAERFFCTVEKQFIAENGEKFFYDIWTRKEAYIKLTGEGLKQGLSTFAVATIRQIYRSVNNMGKYKFAEVDIAPEIKCVVCSEKIDDLEVIYIENDFE